MAKKTKFTLAANIIGDATSGILVGEFNNWDESKGVALKKQKDGSYTAEVALEPGTYHYRYFLSDGRWVNDGNADKYAPVYGLHVDNCVITVVEEAPAPKKTKAKAETTEEAPKAPAKPKKAAAPKKEETADKPAPKTKAKAEPKAEKAPAKPKTTKTKK